MRQLSYRVGSAWLSIEPDFRGVHEKIGAEFAREGDDAGKRFAGTFRDRAAADFVRPFDATVRAQADTLKARTVLDETARTRVADLDVKTRAKAATLELDRLTRDRTVHVDVKTRGGGLRSLLGGGSGPNPAPAAESAASGGGGGMSAAPWLIGGAAAFGASLLPALVPAATGAGFGAAGLIAADKTDKQFAKRLAGTGNVIKSVLGGAVKPLAGEFSAMLPDVNRFVRLMGPELKAAFTASGPFLAEFATVLMQASQTLLPAFTSVMKEFAPELPALGQGFAILSQGVAGFLREMGPGMSASVTIFKASASVVAFTLKTTGMLASGLALEFADAGHGIRVGWHDTAAAFDVARRTVARDFDAMRHGSADWGHYMAHTFDSVRHGVAGVGHGFASAFDGVRGTLHRWYSDTVNAGSKVLHWLGGVPGRIGSAFRGAGTWLWDAGVAVLRGLLSGLVAEWSNVTSFIGGIGSWIAAHKGPLSYDRMLLRPAGLAIMGGFHDALAEGYGRVQALTRGIAPSLSAALPGLGGAAAPGPLRLAVTYAGSGNELADAVVSALQFHVAAATGGDVQAALGQGAVR